MVIVSLTPSLHSLAAPAAARSDSAGSGAGVGAGHGIAASWESFLRSPEATRGPGCWDGLPGLENGGLMVL